MGSFDIAKAYQSYRDCVNERTVKAGQALEQSSKGFFLVRELCSGTWLNRPKISLLFLPKKRYTPSLSSAAMGFEESWPVLFGEHRPTKQRIPVLVGLSRAGSCGGDQIFYSKE